MHNLHGEITTSVSEQLLLVSARGPFNDEAMRVSVGEMSKNINSIIKSAKTPSVRWAHLTVLHGESLMPPSTFDIFIKQTKIRRARGMVFLAVIIKDSDITRTIHHQLRYCYEKAEINFAFFDDIDSALKAIAQRDILFHEGNVKAFFGKNDFSS